MGLDPKTLPDSLLSRVSSADRKAAKLPPPMTEIVSRLTARTEVKKEKELQNQIESWLRLKGITPIRSRMDKRTSNNKGCPDFLFALKGKAVAIEAKLSGQQPTIEQQQMLVALAKDGWAVRVCHSLDEARYFVASIL